jgi:translation initiation factor 5
MANDRYIVNGAHQADRLRELLDSFIDKFVLCPSCKNPETELVITGKGNNEDVHRDCKACGRQNGVDMRHKLVTFILKNPPKKKVKGGKGGKKGMTAEANVVGPMVFEKGDEGSEDDIAEGSPTGTPNMGVPTRGTDIDAMLGKSDPVIGDPDAAEEISKKLQASNLNGNGHANGDDDEDEDADSPYAVFGAWAEENKDASDADVIAKIKDLGVVGKHKVLVGIGHKLFTDETVDKDIAKRAALLQAVSQPLHIMYSHCYAPSPHLSA